MSLAGHDRRWLVRGAAIGAGAMLVFMLVAIAFAGALSTGADTTWADRREMTAILFTAFWAVAAAGAAAIGAFQAAEHDAPDHASVRLAGALGPVAIIVLASLWGLGGDDASIAAIVIEAVVEIGAAIMGATALARRLEPGW